MLSLLLTLTHRKGGWAGHETKCSLFHVFYSWLSATDANTSYSHVLNQVMCCMFVTFENKCICLACWKEEITPIQIRFIFYRHKQHYWTFYKQHTRFCGRTHGAFEIATSSLLMTAGPKLKAGVCQVSRFSVLYKNDFLWIWQWLNLCKEKTLREGISMHHSLYYYSEIT